MAKAEIISIGTELLLGEILDTNVQHIAKELRHVGVDLYWTTTVGDNQQRIAEAIRHGLSRADIILCTGGLGPTVDDMSREGIAEGLGLKLKYHEELWKEIQDRFSKFGREASENNKKQANIPEGALVIDNPNGSAPAFLFERNEQVVISMPGVPKEMKHILEHSVLPHLRKHYDNDSVIVSRILHTAGIGESMIDERIVDLEEKANPTVGLAAHTGAVDIRLTAKASGKEKAEIMLDALEAQIRERIGEWIFGRDGESQAEAIQKELRRLEWRLAVFQFGFRNELSDIFGGKDLEQLPMNHGEGKRSGDALHKKAKEWSDKNSENLAIAVQLVPKDESIAMWLVIYSPNGDIHKKRSYGGQIDAAEELASKQAAEILRRYLLDQ